MLHPQSGEKERLTGEIMGEIMGEISGELMCYQIEESK